jgi:hypothetical protein
MTIKRGAAALGGLGLLAIASFPAAAAPSVENAGATAADAFVYGYSLITTDVTRIQMSNVDKAAGLQAPVGQFINIPRYPPADYRGVSAPNADTLYSLAWVDVSKPQVFSHPDMGERFYLFEMTDLWMKDFDTPGTRTQGGKAATYLLTGPGWTGEVPAGMTQIKSETRYMVILGRTYADGSDADYAKVNALQAHYKLVPLSERGKEYKPVAPPVDANPGISMSAKPQEVIAAMDASTYFNLLAKLMCTDAPPTAEDAPIIARMATIGLEPCKPFDLTKFDSATQSAVNDSVKTGWQRIEGNQKGGMGRIENGWTISTGLGVYGTNYLKRATVAAYGWPANLQEDAVYPYTLTDSSGAQLDGANNYTLTFPKGQTPPVNGFWSITMYMVDGGWWFTPNALNKFTVSPRDGLKTNADGSTTLYFQAASPGADKEANWLPAPKGQFIPMLRMYWPKDTDPSILNGTWTPPAVLKVGG